MKKIRISKSELAQVKGGRTVEKIDHDGDGRWDEKIVYRNDGSVRKRVIRA